MQEEVNQKTVALSIRTTKLTGKVLAAALGKVARAVQKHHRKALTPQGRQSVKKLMNHYGGKSAMPYVGAPKDFDRIAKEFHVDYAFHKVSHGHYLLFFKANQADAITAAFQKYSAKVLNKEQDKASIRTKKMVADPVAADHVRLMFEMYAEPETSFGDITRYFEEHDIKIYGKSMFRTFLSQLLRNPVYAQADLELYEFFKSQGAAIVNDASDFAGTNGCYLYQGRDVKEDKDRCLKDQILVIAPHEALISSDTWLKCRKKLMANTTFQQGRKPKNTWLAGKIKCGHCGYALKATHVPNSTGYFRCTKRTENKGCPGCGKIRKEEFEQFIFSAMQEKFKDFQILHGKEEKVNPKLTAYQVELAQVEAEIEKLLDTLTGANATLLAYANKKIEELDTRRQTISKAIAELSVETISPQQIKKLSYYLDNWESIDFDDKRKAADGLISTIKATSDRVQIEWKI